jgi:hypothetical protein
VFPTIINEYDDFSFAVHERLFVFSPQLILQQKTTTYSRSEKGRQARLRQKFRKEFLGIEAKPKPQDRDQEGVAWLSLPAWHPLYWEPKDNIKAKFMIGLVAHIRSQKILSNYPWSRITITRLIAKLQEYILVGPSRYGIVLCFVDF